MVYAIIDLSSLPSSLSPMTKSAIAHFQNAEGIVPTGRADVHTIITLFKRARNSRSPSRSPIAQERNPAPEPLPIEEKPKLGAHLSPVKKTHSRTATPERLSQQIPSHVALAAQLSSANRRSLPMPLDGILRPHPTLGMADSYDSSSQLNSSGQYPSTPLSISMQDLGKAQTKEKYSTPRENTLKVEQKEESPSKTPAQSRGTNETPASDSVYEQLYLRVPKHAPAWVYFGELQEITTLVVISQGAVSK